MKTNPHLRTIFFCIALLFITQITKAQNIVYPVNEWVKKLSSKDYGDKDYYTEIRKTFKGKDSAEVFNIIYAIKKAGDTTNEYFNARTKLLTAFAMFDHRRDYNTILNLLQQALHESYELNDVYLQYQVSWPYAEIAYDYKKVPLAVLYGLMAIEIDDKYHIDSNLSGRQYIRFVMGEILYHAGEYRKSLQYSRQSIQYPERNAPLRTMMAWNTIGLAWQKLADYDSAVYAYEQSIHFAKNLDNAEWVGIASGNMGQVYYLQKKYDTAKALLEFDYKTSRQNGVLDDAANSLQWAARINLIQGYKDSALLQVKESMLLLQQMPDVNYLQNIYYTAADVYRSFDNLDSFYHYSQLYANLHDSLEKVAALSSIGIATIKMENEKDIHTIQMLQQQEETEKLKRNFIIAAIILCSLVIILVFSRQKQKLKHNQQLALQQKATAESGITAAKEQMNMFTQNIIEKTNIIEKLKEQLNTKTLTIEQQELITQLSHQTILTEEDWEKFKLLFEKIYPAFFHKLREKAPDITAAEQRMAALARLQLTAKQMASILGISPDSVYKTKQRVRRRLQLSPEENIEEYIAKV